MTTWNNTSKNSSSYSNVTRNTSVFSNISRSTNFIDYLLLESGQEILTESALFLILEQSALGPQSEWNNQQIS